MESNINKIVTRALELKLCFSDIYFLILGDYAIKDCVRVLMLYVEQGQLSSHNFIRLIKIMPNEVA